MAIRIYNRCIGLFIYVTLLLKQDKMKKIISFLFIVCTSVAINAVYAQCSMCRAVLESEADGGAAEAINDGIMYLMVFPYILVAGVGFAIYRLMRTSK